MGCLGPRAAFPQQVDDKMRKAVPEPALLLFTRALLDMIDHHHLLRETSKTQRPATLAPQAHESVFRPPGLNVKQGIEPAARPFPVTAWTPGSPQHPASPRSRMRRGGGGAGAWEPRGGTVHSTSLSMALRFGAPGRTRHGWGPSRLVLGSVAHPSHRCPQLAPFLGVCSGCFLLG